MPRLEERKGDRGKTSLAGTITDVPKAEEDCLRHWVQWQW
jgi:hypothetical protein